jgi:hypothetical protein
MKRFQAIAAATVLTAMASAGSASTVVNGSFEDVSGGSVLLNNGSWVVYDTLPGWTTIDGNGIEVQTNPTLGSIDAQDGNRYVELDSHPGGNSNSTMRQQISLGVGEYRLSFFYSPRTTDASTNGIFYSVSEAISGGLDLTYGQVSGPSGTYPRTVWTEVIATFTVATAGLFNLDFGATGRADTYGGLIDNVSIAPVPLPAGAVLLLTALGGLAVARKRKTA